MPNPQQDTLIKNELELFHVSLNQNEMSISLEISLLLLGALFLIPLIAWITRFRQNKYKLVKLNITLGNIGEVEFAPSDEDIQIAHRIWTELVTRKAALPFDANNDVIIEVYDSWYVLFVKVRELISEIPANLVRKEKSTKEIINIATKTLNDGLRPHLTKWQASFRNWYKINSDKLDRKTPQELQQEYPKYDELVAEIGDINNQLMEYASELKKIIDG